MVSGLRYYCFGMNCVCSCTFNVSVYSLVAAALFLVLVVQASFSLPSSELVEHEGSQFPHRAAIPAVCMGKQHHPAGMHRAKETVFKQ